MEARKRGQYRNFRQIEKLIRAVRRLTILNKLMFFGYRKFVHYKLVT